MEKTSERSLAPVGRATVLNAIPQQFLGFNPLIVAAALSRSVPSRAILKTNQTIGFKIMFWVKNP
jgi:hypothetical protein